MTALYRLPMQPAYTASHGGQEVTGTSTFRVGLKVPGLGFRVSGGSTPCTPLNP